MENQQIRKSFISIAITERSEVPSEQSPSSSSESSSNQHINTSFTLSFVEGSNQLIPKFSNQ